MEWLWLGLGAIVGYWTSEWPRYAFPAEDRPIAEDRMTDASARQSATLFYPWVLVLAPLLTLIGFVSAYHLAPELSGRFLPAWGPFVGLGAFGTTIGAFEIVTGLSPDFWIFGNERDHRFYLDRERSRKTGTWRVVSCLVLNVMVFVASRLLQS